jgi:hypothetical protein
MASRRFAARCSSGAGLRMSPRPQVTAPPDAENRAVRDDVSRLTAVLRVPTWRVATVRKR